jgi:hypothetical protein
VLSPTISASLAGKHCNLDFCHVKKWFKIGIYFFGVAFFTHVISNGKYSINFIRIFDDSINSSLGFSR